MSHRPPTWHPRRQLPGILLVLGATLVAPEGARGQAVQETVRLQLLTPALSADGRSVAFASLDPAGHAGAHGSLAVFDASGTLKRRQPLYAPRDGERGGRSYAEAHRVLERGGYQRLARLRPRDEQRTVRRIESDPPPRTEVLLSQGEYGFTISAADGRVRVEAMRGERKLGTVALPLRKPESACRFVAAYSLTAGRIGFDPASRILAFSVVSESGEGVPCFSSEYVLRLR